MSRESRYKENEGYWRGKTPTDNPPTDLGIKIGIAKPGTDIIPDGRWGSRNILRMITLIIRLCYVGPLYFSSSRLSRQYSDLEASLKERLLSQRCCSLFSSHSLSSQYCLAQAFSRNDASRASPTGQLRNRAALFLINAYDS